MYFNASVTDNTLEIRVYWAGKGTTRIPLSGHYGPLVSAISVQPCKFLFPNSCLLFYFGWLDGDLEWLSFLLFSILEITISLPKWHLHRSIDSYSTKMCFVECLKLHMVYLIFAQFCNGILLLLLLLVESFCNTRSPCFLITPSHTSNQDQQPLGATPLYYQQPRYIYIYIHLEVANNHAFTPKNKYLPHILTFYLHFLQHQNQ